MTLETLRMIGRLCVRRSPKINVEEALAVAPLPEIYHDAGGNIVVQQTPEQLQRQQQEAALKQEQQQQQQQVAVSSDGKPEVVNKAADGRPTTTANQAVLPEVQVVVSAEPSPATSARQNDVIDP